MQQDEPRGKLERGPSRAAVLVVRSERLPHARPIPARPSGGKSGPVHHECHDRGAGEQFGLVRQDEEGQRRSMSALALFVLPPVSLRLASRANKLRLAVPIVARARPAGHLGVDLSGRDVRVAE